MRIGLHDLSLSEQLSSRDIPYVLALLTIGASILQPLPFFLFVAFPTLFATLPNFGFGLVFLPFGLFVNLPFAAYALSFLPSTRGGLTPKGNRSWLTIKYLFQIASWYIVPIAYGCFLLVAILAHSPSDRLASVLLSLELLYVISTSWFSLMSNTLANPENPNAGLYRDILAYSELAKILCRNKSPVSVRFTYAATRRIYRHLRDRRIRSRLLQLVNDRLRSMLVLRSVDYEILSDLAESLHSFPDMKRIRMAVLKFLYNPESRWLDDFEYAGPFGSPTLRGLPQYVITAIGTVIAFLALFVPDVRLRAIKLLEPLFQAVTLEKTLVAVAVFFFFSIFLAVDTHSKPALSWSLVQIVDEKVTAGPK